MTALEFKKALARGLSGGYLFCGEEDYLKRHYLSETRKTLLTDEAFRPFNHLRISGDHLSAEAVIEAITIPPTMSDKKLVELTDVDFSSMQQGEVDALIEALSYLKDYPEAVLILYTTPADFDAGSLPRRPSALYKRLSEVLVPVIFEYGTVRQLTNWVMRHFEKEGITASNELCTYLIENTGRKMTLLYNEISKLSAYIKATGREELTREDIHLITAPDIETDTFALANAILAKDVNKAFAALVDMDRKKITPDLALAGIAKVYADLLLIKSHMNEGFTASAIASKLKMHEYRVKLYLSATATMPIERLENTLALCADTDILIKSRQGGYTVLERLICEAAQK
ncbi:MAG: DNA polymerase III subunit delta [Clostridiales bacterium]|nr:DNA polymerase III subunit delta [Clostridiales bacterium]